MQQYNYNNGDIKCDGYMWNAIFCAIPQQYNTINIELPLNVLLHKNA